MSISIEKVASWRIDCQYLNFFEKSNEKNLELDVVLSINSEGMDYSLLLKTKHKTIDVSKNLFRGLPNIPQNSNVDLNKLVDSIQNNIVMLI